MFTDKSSEYVKFQTLSNIRSHTLLAFFSEFFSELGLETLTSAVNTLLGAFCRRTHVEFKCRRFEAPQGSFDCIKSSNVSIKQTNKKSIFFPSSRKGRNPWSGLTWPPLLHLRRKVWVPGFSSFRQVKRGEEQTLPLHSHPVPNDSSFVCYINCLLGWFVPVWFIIDQQIRSFLFCYCWLYKDRNVKKQWVYPPPPHTYTILNLGLHK